MLPNVVAELVPHGSNLFDVLIVALLVGNGLAVFVVRERAKRAETKAVAAKRSQPPEGRRKAEAIESELNHGTFLHPTPSDPEAAADELPPHLQ